jgi:hypothetical protein
MEILETRKSPVSVGNQTPVRPEGLGKPGNGLRKLGNGLERLYVTDCEDLTI